MDLCTKRTLPIPHRIADYINNLLAKDSVIFSKTQYQCIKEWTPKNIWGWCLFSLTMMSYLASGVFVNSFIMSRFGTYGPFFSFLKSPKCEFYEQKDFSPGTVKFFGSLLESFFHLGLESFSKILLEFTVSRRWMSAVSKKKGSTTFSFGQYLK